MIRRTLPIAILVLFVGALLWLRWTSREDDPPFSIVEDGLAMGRWVKHPPDGTRAVVNLCGREDPYSVEAKLDAPIFEGGVEPDLDWLRRIVDFVDAQRRAGRPVYVHCLAGRNQSGAAVTACLMREHGWSRDKALAHLRSKRPVVHPNPVLMQLLAEWERTLDVDRQVRP